MNSFSLLVLLFGFLKAAAPNRATVGLGPASAERGIALQTAMRKHSADVSHSYNLIARDLWLTSLQSMLQPGKTSVR